MKLLWLASWYPNPYEPVNGDFIQRHAQAVAELTPIDLIHVVQAGHRLPVENEQVWTNKKKGLTEYIHAFKFKTLGNDWLDKIRYNILYHHYYKKIIAAYIAQNGRPDLIHVHVPVKAGLVAIAVVKKYGIPFIVSEQSSHYETASPDYFFKRSNYFQRNTKRIFKEAIAVTNVSATIGKKLQSIFDIKNYRTIHNLADTDLFYYQPKERNNKLRFLHVSAMVEQKNPAGIIKALAQFNNLFKDWECTFCGPYKNDLQLLTTQLGLEKQIQFTGEIDYVRVATAMQQADVFILFSNHENFPCVVVEALCCGLPVIAANAGGVAEAVNESNGIIVAAANIDELAKAMYKVAPNIHHYDREEISKNAIAQYNKKIIAAQFVELYNEIVSKNDGKPQKK
ncbi:glycosyltransferase family 4 protein [soil metagenome]